MSTLPQSAAPRHFLETRTWPWPKQSPPPCAWSALGLALVPPTFSRVCPRASTSRSRPCPRLPLVGSYPATGAAVLAQAVPPPRPPSPQPRPPPPTLPSTCTPSPISVMRRRCHTSLRLPLSAYPWTISLPNRRQGNHAVPPSRQLKPHPLWSSLRSSPLFVLILQKSSQPLSSPRRSLPDQVPVRSRLGTRPSVHVVRW
mmetsp:Transcript_66320/g.156625  ORF Transcript_66320/g.156625 Transcript_66320/m.156625 type:complete len:200 (+) Transcript_66320:555-1154(+)